jgi:sugar lactone lactonase YvrE
VVALGVLSGLALVGCGSSGGTGPSGAGSLTVTITAPAGVTPSVTVSGPAGYRQSLSATQTLSGLAVGNYTVTAASVAVSNPIVATVYAGTVTGETATVSAGATATASVSYAARPGSGALWVANSNGSTVVAYTAAQLGASTGAAPATALTTGAGAIQSGVAFDAGGNLWVASYSNNTVVEFTASQLGASGSPAPAVTLSATGGSLNRPTTLAFDASGTLWVGNVGSNTVVAFTASQLGASGSPAPAVTLSATGGSLNNPIALAFDVSGTLWVTNDVSSTVVAFAPSQLTASGSPAPAVTLSATGGSLNAPEALAFDVSGTLWVGNAGSNTVVAFTASQLGASGSPMPTATLSPNAGSLNAPVGLAFDASGSLWVANAANNTVVAFAASQLVGSGAPAPTVTLSGSSLAGPVGLAFDPPSENLPLR